MLLVAATISRHITASTWLLDKCWRAYPHVALHRDEPTSCCMNRVSAAVLHILLSKCLALVQECKLLGVFTQAQARECLGS